MTRRRDIGEFRIRAFVIATLIFLLSGGYLYSRFTFKVDPNVADEIVSQQKEIKALEEQTNKLQQAVTDVQTNEQRTREQDRSAKAPLKGPDNRIKPSKP
jgi:FtsZ-binding cell division protein ZapB